MAANQFNLLADMKSIEAEVDGIQQCDKCREMSSYLFKQHWKFHPDQEFDTCDICYTKKFKLGLLHLSVHTKLLQVNKSAQNVQLNQIVKLVETDTNDSKIVKVVQTDSSNSSCETKEIVTVVETDSLSETEKNVKVVETDSSCETKDIVEVIETDSSDSICETTNSVQVVKIVQSEKVKENVQDEVVDSDPSTQAREMVQDIVKDDFVKTDEVEFYVKTDKTDNVQDSVLSDNIDIEYFEVREINFIVKTENIQDSFKSDKIDILNVDDDKVDFIVKTDVKPDNVQESIKTDIIYIEVNNCDNIKNIDTILKSENDKANEVLDNNDEEVIKIDSDDINEEEIKVKVYLNKQDDYINLLPCHLCNIKCKNTKLLKEHMKSIHKGIVYFCDSEKHPLCKASNDLSNDTFNGLNNDTFGTDQHKMIDEMSQHENIYDSTQFENIDVINMTADEYYDLYIEPQILKILERHNFAPFENNYEEENFEIEYCEGMSIFQEISLVENIENMKNLPIRHILGNQRTVQKVKLKKLSRKRLKRKLTKVRLKVFRRKTGLNIKRIHRRNARLKIKRVYKRKCRLKIKTVYRRKATLKTKRMYKLELLEYSNVEYNKDFSHENACEQCNKKCFIKPSLYMHITKTHEGIDYACEQCDCKYAMKERLQMCIRKSHEYNDYYKYDKNKHFPKRKKKVKEWKKRKKWKKKESFLYKYFYI